MPQGTKHNDNGDHLPDKLSEFATTNSVVANSDNLSGR